MAALGRVVVIGNGKVGRALRTGLVAGGVAVTMRPARSLLQRPLPRADLIIIASRDGRIAEIAAVIATAEGAPAAVVHCAGALDSEPLALLRQRGVAIGVMHPCLSFPTPKARVLLAGGALVITGDPLAVRRSRAVARALGMVAVCPALLDRATYHAACSLTANGGAALAAASARLLVAAGIEHRFAARLLGPLLVSVGRNIERLGAAQALSGPVRRGDLATVRNHQAAVDSQLPDLSNLFRTIVDAQRSLV